MTPERMHELFYKKIRKEKLQSFMNDKEAVDALKLIMNKGHAFPAIEEAYFCIKEDLEIEKLDKE